MKKIKISDFIQDTKNHNKHTEEGMALLENSIHKVGVIESITISNDNHIISGNARQETMDRILNTEPIVIETDGTRPIILKRTDIESDTKQFYEASILANTTSKKNINIDEVVIEELIEQFEIDAEELGLDLSISLEDINKKDFSDKEFENEFNRIKNENAATPIVANFNEKNELFLIPIDNEIDELFIRELFKLNETKQFNTIKGKSNIITIEDIKCLIQNLSK